MTCHQEYHYSHKGQLDLRLRSRRLYQLQFEIGTDPEFAIGSDLLSVHPPLKVLERNPKPAVDFTGMSVPWHLTGALMSHFPKAKSGDSVMLDLGCGNSVHRDVCLRAGFEYVGFDFDSPEAQILGDAHALPFRDNSFEFVLMMAVLMQIRYPFVAMKEVFRVMRSGGRFIGTVAFLQPIAEGNYYHHSYLGTLNSLDFAGFDVQNISPSVDFTALIALATMILFPKLPRVIAKSIVMPLQALHRIWWTLGHMLTHSRYVTEQRRLLSTTGYFSFVATKQDSGRGQPSTGTADRR